MFVHTFLSTKCVIEDIGKFAYLQDICRIRITQATHKSYLIYYDNKK